MIEDAHFSAEERVRRYRRLAGTARRFADNAPTDELRRSYTQFAERWDGIADDLDHELKKWLS